jgi:hypothetical protein
MAKKTWKIFWDLECPFARKNWEQLPAIRAKLEGEYEFSIHLTSLALHLQAFPAQCAATLIQHYKGRDAMLKFVDGCFESQSQFTDAGLGDCRKSDLIAVFANIAEKCGLLDEELNREKFIAECNDWEKAVKPAFMEHKVALAYGVYGTPKHVIDEKLVADTDSAWGPDEWIERLKTL